MKSLKLKKIVAAVVAAATIATVSPVGASAAWKQDSNGWWNTKGSSYSTGWESIDGNWYYFDSTGYMKTGWANDNGTWYYLQPSGAMKTGWVNDGGTWYYMQSSGAMKTGWVNDNGTWYFTATSGAMQTGVVEVDGKVYCLAASGAMQTGNVVINGTTYTFDVSGAAVGDKIPTVEKAFSGAGVAVSKPSQKPDSGESAGSTGGGSSSHSNSGSSYVELSQAVIDAQYQSATKITKSIEVSKNEKGTLIKPTFSFKPGTYTELIAATGKNYTVTKDVYVTLNGSDAYISGNYEDGYTIEKGAEGRVKIIASISVLDNITGKLYYVTPSVTEIVDIPLQFDK